MVSKGGGWGGCWFWGVVGVGGLVPGGGVCCGEGVRGGVGRRGRNGSCLKCCMFDACIVYDDDGG